ncbi:MAG: prenyltransferase/squalene oxidase repeat-containing protein [Planctomycetota bacterium]
MRLADLLPVTVALTALLSALALAPDDPARGARPPPSRTDTAALPPMPAHVGASDRAEAATREGGTIGARRRLVARCGGCCAGCADHGLQWLEIHQDPRGFWDADGFFRRCRTEPRCKGDGAADMDTAVTGLALLTFLGAGETHKHGQHKQTVKAALKHLMEIQGEYGSFANVLDRRSLLCHSIATLAVCEAYHWTKSPLLKSSAQRAVDHLEMLRFERYGAAATTWTVMALRSAVSSGLRVDVRRLEKAGAWFQGNAYHHLAWDGSPPSTLNAVTAAGVLCRILVGEDPRKSAIAKAGGESLRRALSIRSTDPLDPGAWYFGTLACYQIGGETWKTWWPALKEDVIGGQRRKGCAKGSWDPAGIHGGDLGRVGVTALMMMSRQVYYRYARVFGTR